MSGPETPCGRCGACCKTTNEYAVILFPADVERLSAALSLPAAEFLRLHGVSRTVSGVTVWYLRKQDEACRFLEGRLCAVYPARPVQCRLAPYRFFSDYANWSHVPCIGSEAEFNAQREDSAESDKSLLRTLLSPGYSL